MTQEKIEALDQSIADRNEEIEGLEIVKEYYLFILPARHTKKISRPAAPIKHAPPPPDADSQAASLPAEHGFFSSTPRGIHAQKNRQAHIAALDALKNSLKKEIEQCECAGCFLTPNDLLYIAFHRADVQAIEYLLSRQITSDSLSQIIHTKNSALISFLQKKRGEVNLDRYANPIAHLDTPLTCAVREGYLEVVKLLLKKKVDVAQENRCAETALEIALQQENSPAKQLFAIRLDLDRESKKIQKRSSEAEAKAVSKKIAHLLSQHIQEEKGLPPDESENRTALEHSSSEEENLSSSQARGGKKSGLADHQVVPDACSTDKKAKAPNKRRERRVEYHFVIQRRPEGKPPPLQAASSDQHPVQPIDTPDVFSPRPKSWHKIRADSPAAPPFGASANLVSGFLDGGQKPTQEEPPAQKPLVNSKNGRTPSPF
jgi:hypothetical protein